MHAEEQPVKAWPKLKEYYPFSKTPGELAATW
jgi:hypothetical protein